MGGCLFLNTYLKYKDHNLLSTHINQLVLVCIFLTASPPPLPPPKEKYSQQYEGQNEGHYCLSPKTSKVSKCDSRMVRGIK